jgi:glucose/arabinose dehydrogenase
MRLKHLLFVGILLGSIDCHAAPALERVAADLERPVWVGAPGNDSAHLWVVEQAGKVWILDRKSGVKIEEPFLDLSETVSREDNEEGLLGLAFAPDYAKSGRFYVNYVDKERTTRIVRFKVSSDPLKANPENAEILLSIKQPFGNHNGGWIGFGPDGFLYVGMGDGGSGNDPKKAGQDMDTLLAKMLRIDVAPAKGYAIPKDNPFKDSKHPEIWAIGLRNPWRCSFDRKTGDLWIGDVGQNTLEEIDFLPAGTGAGANFGWSLREGNIATPAEGVGGDKPAGNVEPIYVYKHGGGNDEGNSVTGGIVYRGPIKEFDGLYFFADYIKARLWSLQRSGDKVVFKDHPIDLGPGKGRLGPVASFGEDNDGNLYVVDHNGGIFRLVSK